MLWSLLFILSLLCFLFFVHSTQTHLNSTSGNHVFSFFVPFSSTSPHRTSLSLPPTPPATPCPQTDSHRSVCIRLTRHRSWGKPRRWRRLMDRGSPNPRNLPLSRCPTRPTIAHGERGNNDGNDAPWRLMTDERWHLRTSWDDDAWPRERTKRREGRIDEKWEELVNGQIIRRKSKRGNARWGQKRRSW